MLDKIKKASENIRDLVKNTPLEYNKRLSELYGANVYFKRDDLQEVRSFKIRGAYNAIKSLSEDKRNKGVVCASAGNHAQGVALSCSTMKIKGYIFMPSVTPNQKINKVRKFGGDYIEIKIVGDNFDEANKMAMEFCEKNGNTFVSPFDDDDVIAGQGTIAKEITDTMTENNLGNPDVVLVAIGGGGMVSGVGSYFKEMNINTKVIGVEPTGADSMYRSLKENKVVSLDKVDTFCDGVAVKRVGDRTFEIGKNVIDEMVIVDEGRVATDMIELYQYEGIVTEPAGALSVSALTKINYQIKGKNVICIICGGNNDLLRYPEILERSLIWQGKKYYFIVQFAQKPGQLRLFLDKVLGSDDDIVRFEYVKSTNKEKGPALVGIELGDPSEYGDFISRFNESGIAYQELKSDDVIYKLMV